MVSTAVIVLGVAISGQVPCEDSQALSPDGATITVAELTAAGSPPGRLSWCARTLGKAEAFVCAVRRR
jgi:hypothetical protein